MVTIVVPVYNARSSIEECLASIAAQSYRDWECVVVDDGSTDGSGGICDRFQLEDSRFKVFHQANRGVSATRNKALDAASGDYVAFVDADDALMPDAIEKLVAAIGDSDLVVAGMRHEYRDGKTKIVAPATSGRFELLPRETEKMLDLERKFLLYAPHEKLYRRSIIERFSSRFEEGCSYGEDLMFNFGYLEHVGAISCIENPIYKYRISGEGLSAAYRPDQFSQDYSQWKLVRSFYERKGMISRQLDEYHFRRLWGIVYDGLFAYPKQESKRGYIESILDIPEIASLDKHRDVFSCSNWIKKAILGRNKFVFKAFFRLRK